MDWPNPTPSPSLLPQLTLGGEAEEEAGLSPGPLPSLLCLQGQAPSIHCWAVSKEQWLPSEEVGVQGSSARVEARPGRILCPSYCRKENPRDQASSGLPKVT